jgi:hypothetical protein
MSAIDYNLDNLTILVIEDNIGDFVLIEDYLIDQSEMSSTTVLTTIVLYIVTKYQKRSR